jgi:pimeloyl-ACP methyl ester carboxylesterase
MQIVYIHGASATEESFNYIREHIDVPSVSFNYESSNGFKNNLEIFKEKLKTLKDVFFIAHSLGGIYALHLANHFPKNVIGAVTISTPYGGSQEADYAKYFLPFSRLMRDIGPHSDPMKLAAKIKVQHPWANIVTLRGNSPFILEPNDGVVTIKSMKHHGQDMELIEVNYNHYEVVMSPTVVEIIKSKLEKI